VIDGTKHRNGPVANMFKWLAQWGCVDDLGRRLYRRDCGYGGPYLPHQLVGMTTQKEKNMYEDRIIKALQFELPLINNIDVQRAARRIADSVYGYVTVTGVRLNGKRVKIETIDKGSNIPGYEKDGTRYEAFTRWWRVIPRIKKYPNKPSEEDYIQVDYALAIHSGNVRAYREAAEIAHFIKSGFDPYSFQLPDGSAMYVKGGV